MPEVVLAMKGLRFMAFHCGKSGRMDAHAQMRME